MDHRLILKFQLHVFLMLACACLQPVLASPSPLRLGDYAEIVASAAGKPLVVYIWETGCTYCKTNMVLLRKLLDQHPAADVTFVAVDPSRNARQVADVLSEYRLGSCPAWIFADAPSWLRREIDVNWKGEIPRTYFYDPQGQVHVVTGVLNEATTREWFAEMYKPTTGDISHGR